MDGQSSSSQTAPVPEKPQATRFNTPTEATNDPSSQQQQQQQQQAQSQPFEIPRYEPFRNGKVFSVAKLVLGCFNLVFAIIALGLSLDLVIASYGDDLVVDIIIAVTAFIAIVWQIAEIITLAARRDWRPIHPGAHVGIHLILWVLCILVVVSLSFTISDVMDDYSIQGQCEDSADDCSWYTFADEGAAARYFRMMEALDAFSVLMLISTFTLFVMACVECDRRRKYGRRTKVVYLVAGPGPIDGRVYYTPVPPPQLKRGSVAVQARPLRLAEEGGSAAGAEGGAYGYFAPAAPAPATVHHNGSPPGTAV